MAFDKPVHFDACAVRLSWISGTVIHGEMFEARWAVI
jgi:hypothetical protein